MNYIEKEYKSIITRIGLSLLFFLFVFNLLNGGTQIVTIIAQSFWANSDIVYIITDLASSLAYLVSFILPVPFFYLISKGIKTHSMNLTLTLPSPYPLLKLVAFVWAGIAVIIPMAYLNSLLYPVSYDVTVELFDLDFSKPYMLVLSMISTAIVPAFAEEFLFRGLIVSNIKPYNKGAAVVISAITFGLMHQNPMQLLYATVAGIVFGLVYVETESIWCCIILHFVNNFISIMQSYFSYILNSQTADLLIYFFDVFVVLGGMVCALFVLRSMRKNKVKRLNGVFGVYDRAVDQTSYKINFIKCGLLSPAVLIFILLCVVQCVINAVALNLM